MPSNRLAAIVLAVVIAAVAGERILVAPQLHDQRAFPKYLELSDRILAGDLPRERLNDVSPVYLWTVVLLKTLGAGDGAIRALQIAATGAAAVLLAAAAWPVAGAAGGWTAALLVLGSQAVFINATEFEPETLILLLNAAAIFFLVRNARFASGLMLALSAATRPSALLPLVVLGAWIAWRDRRRAVAYAAGAAIPLAALLAVTFALTGRATIMNPGTVFFEGMNPLSMGYATAEPLVVADLQNTIDQPDPLHAAYRLAASRAAGRSVTVEETNRFWTSKAVRFARAFPLEAARLVIRKTILALHSYDAWDLATMVRRERDSDSRPWIPFGAAVALAAVAVVAVRRPEVTLAALFALCNIAVLALFFVTSRQRNALVPAIAFLGAIGAAHLVELLRARSRRSVAMFGFVIVAAVLSVRDYRPQAEDRYAWTATFQSERFAAAAAHAEKKSDPSTAARLRAIDGTWLLGDDLHIPSVLPAMLGVAARGEIARAESNARLFDIAVALLKAGDLANADKVLEHLASEDYRPMRKLSATGSVAYYRALAFSRMNRRDEALALLDRALKEAPADANVLALAAVLREDRRALSLLQSIHDPFTVQMALARADFEAGRIDRAIEILKAINASLPEWPRAQLLREYLQDVRSLSGAPASSPAMPSSSRRRPLPAPAGTPALH